MENARSLVRDARLLYLLYIPALIAGIALLPLWLPEILQLAGAVDPGVIKLYDFIRIPRDTSQLQQLLNWAAASPNGSPTGYLIQYPFVALLGFSPWAARLPSILLALLNVFLFWKLTKRCNVLNGALAVVLFATVPIHYRFSVEARPFELGLTAVLISSLCFLRLMEQTNIRNAVYYCLALIFCLYSVPRSIIPGVCLVLSTLAFIQSKEVRTALWHLLPAVAGASLIYLPYFVWAQKQHLLHRLVPQDTYWLTSADWPMAFRDVTGGGYAGYVLTLLLMIGMGIGVWRAFKYSQLASQFKRLALLCIFGASLLSLTINLALDSASDSPFEPSQMLWSLPGFMILFTAGLDWLQSKSRYAPWAFAAVFLFFSIGGNYTFLTSRDENFKSIAAAALPELQKDSCVVFVSERLSPLLFRTIEPKLSAEECLEFFHPRIVMLIHPYVEEAQQKDAEVYFRGLNFHDVKRTKVGGGEVIVVEGAQQ